MIDMWKAQRIAKKRETHFLEMKIRKEENGMDGFGDKM